MHVTGWFDACAPGEFHHYHQMVALSPASRDQSLLVGAWGHGGACTTGQAIEGVFDLGSEASIDLPAVWLTWFDRWLRGVESELVPPVRYFAWAQTPGAMPMPGLRAMPRSRCCTSMPMDCLRPNHQQRRPADHSTMIPGILLPASSNSPRNLWPIGRRATWRSWNAARMCWSTR